MRSVSVLRLFAALKTSLALTVIAVMCCCATGVAASPSADSPVATDRPSNGDDDVWVVSTRRLPDISRLPSHVTFDVERLVPDAACSRWIRSDLPSLLDDPQRPLLIFIHGNRYDSADAKSQGLLLARRLAACHPNAPAARTVIFSWPSSREGHLLRDSRAKYGRPLSRLAAGPGGAHAAGGGRGL